MEQCEKCPMKIVEEYKNMKKNIELDFVNYIAKWFETHPYVDYLYVREPSSCSYSGSSNSMFFHSDRKICCNVTIKN